MKRKRIAKIMVGTLGVPLALLLVAVVALHLGAANDYARGLTEDLVAGALDANLTVNAVSGSPFTTLTLENLKLTTMAGESIVRADRISASLSFAELIDGQVGVDAKLEGVRVFLRSDVDRNLNILSIVPPSEDEESSDMPVSLDLRLQLDESTIVWRDDAASDEGDDLASIGSAFDPQEVDEQVAGIETPAEIRRELPHTAVLNGVGGDIRLVVERDATTTIGIGELGGSLTSVGITGPRALTVRDGVIKAETDGTVLTSFERIALDEWAVIRGMRLTVPTDIEQMRAQVEMLDIERALVRAAAPEALSRSSVHVSFDAAPVDQEMFIVADLRLEPEGDEPSQKLALAGSISNWIEPGSDTAWDFSVYAPSLRPTAIAGVAAPIRGGSLFADISGTGIDPLTMKADARVGVRAADIDAYRLESVFVDAKVRDGVVTVDRALAHTPYASASVGGHWDNAEGTFSVEARALATDAMSGVAKRLLGQELDVRANVTARASGRLDVEQDDPLAMVRELDASASWDISEFAAEDVSIAASTGRLTAGVGDETDGRRSVRYDIDASAQKVRTADIRLARVSVDSDGSSRLEPGAIDTMAMLKQLETKIDLDVQGLIASGTLVRDVSVLATTRPRAGQLGYTLQASAKKTSTDGVNVDDAALDLRGALRLGDTLAWPAALRGFDAKGQLAGRGMKLGTDQAGALTVDIDVSGPIADLGGAVNAEATALKVADYDFETITAAISFTGKREFRIDANATQAERKPKKVGIFARGRYTRDLTDFTILELEFSTVGETWKLSDGFSFDTKKGRASFNDVTLEHGDQRIHVDGYFEQGKGQDIRAEIVDLELATVIDEFGLTDLDPLRGQVNAQVEAGGTAREPTARFSIRLTDLYWEDYGPFAVFVEGRYDERRLVIEKLEADGYDVRLLEGDAELPIRVTTTGEFEILQQEKIDLFLETPTFGLTDLRGVIPTLQEWGVTGAVGMKTRLRGSLVDPSLDVTVTAEKLASPGPSGSQGVKLGPVDIRTTMRYQSPRSSQGGLELTFNGDWEATPPIQGLARVNADVAQWLRDYLAGREVDWLARVEASEWKLLAKAQKFDLRNLRVGALQEADVEGTVSVDISADGTFADPKSSIVVDLDGFGFERYRDVFLDIDASVDKNRVVVRETKLNWDGDDILTAKGSIPAPFAAIFGNGKVDDLPVDFAVELQPLPIAKFSAVDYTFAALSGELSGFIHLTGTLTNPVLDGRFSAVDVEFSDKSRGTIATSVKLSKESVATADLVVCRGPKEVLVGAYEMPLAVNFVKLAAGEELDLSGQVSASLEGENVRLAGLVPNKVVDNYVSGVEGRLSVDMDMAGTLEKPTFDGRFQIDEAALFLGAFSRGFVGINVDVEAKEGGQVTLHDFVVREDRGYASASGDVTMDGWQPRTIDANAKVKNFGTAGFTDLAMFISADADVSGDLSSTSTTAKAKISGLEVVIADAIDESTHSTSLDTDIIVLRRQYDREDAFDFAALESDEPRMSATLEVIVERNSWIRHPQAEVEVMADLKINVTEDSVILTGEAQTVRGTADVLGKRFQIEKGLVTFTGADPPNPRLQIEAVYSLDRSITRQVGQSTSGDPRAIVRVTGSATDPRIRFLSDPEMPESDVIYVLLTNRPPGQAEVGEAEGSGLAAGAASGLASGLIQEKLGKVLPVDVFRVEAGDEGFADPRFEVGKYVLQDVFVSLEYQVGAEQNENTTELNVEYRFLPRWVVVFEGGNLGTGDLNVFWDVY